LVLPLAVIRVLVGDMADGGLVLVHRPTQTGDRPDLALLEAGAVRLAVDLTFRVSAGPPTLAVAAPRGGDAQWGAPKPPAPGDRAPAVTLTGPSRSYQTGQSVLVFGQSAQALVPPERYTR
jgi:hypothetical protein